LQQTTGMLLIASFVEMLYLTTKF